MPNVHEARRQAWFAKVRCEGSKRAKVEAAQAAYDAVISGQKKT